MEVDQQELFQRGQSNAAIQHALPQDRPKQEPKTAENVQAAMRRTDITAENQISEAEQQKRNAYKEELRQQMEQQLKNKADEKARLKREEEAFERDLARQRAALESQENQELAKEGKGPLETHEKGRKVVGRGQFQTSDELARQAPPPKENLEKVAEGSLKEEEIKAV